MVSLALIILFFWLLVLFYPVVVSIVVLVGWVKKRWGRSEVDEDMEKARLHEIDMGVDRLKEFMFKLSLCLFFFVGAPFAMFCIYFMGGIN